MALTKVSQTVFSGTGAMVTTTAMGTGQGTVLGDSMYRVPYGPAITAGNGVSVDFRSGHPYHVVTITNAAAGRAFDCWWYWKDYDASFHQIPLHNLFGSMYTLTIRGAQQSAANLLGLRIVNMPSGDGYFALSSGITAFPKKQGKWLRYAWRIVSGNTIELELYWRDEGGAWELIDTRTVTFNSISTTINAGITQVPLGDGGSHSFKVRYGLPTYYTLGSWADRTLLDSSIIEKPATRTIYLSTASTASAANAGDVQASPITMAELQTRNTYLGVLPGDYVEFDTNPIALPIGDTPLLFRDLNLTVKSGQTAIRAELSKVLHPSDFALASGQSTVYETADTGDKVKVFENGVPLTHVTGLVDASAAGSYENVSASVLRVKFLGGGTQGDSVIKRSRNRGSSPAADAIQFSGDVNSAPWEFIADDSTALNCQQAYIMSIGGSQISAAGNNVTIRGMRGAKNGGDKHVIGSLNYVAGGTHIFEDMDIGPCVLTGTPLVAFYDGTISPKATQIFRRIRLPFTSISDRSGYGGFSNTAYTGHSTAGTFLSELRFDACYIPVVAMPYNGTDGVGEAALTQGETDLQTVQNGCIMGLLSYAAPLTVTKSTLLQFPYNYSGASKALTLQDSVILFTTKGNTARQLVNGPLIIEGCTLDLRKRADLTSGLIDCTNATSIVIRGCVIIGDSHATKNSLLYNVGSGISITFDFNEFYGMTGEVVNTFRGLGNLTLAQLQANGFNVNSKASGVDSGFTLAIDLTTYRRTGPGTVRYNRGASGDRNSLTYDCYGNTLVPVTYARRDEAGAYQYSEQALNTVTNNSGVYGPAGLE